MKNWFISQQCHFVSQRALRRSKENMTILPTQGMRKYKPYHGRVKRRYCSRKRDEKKCYKKWGFIAPLVLLKTRNFITVVSFPEVIQRWVISSWNINILWPFVQLVDVFASLLSFTSPVEIVFVLVFFLFHWSHPVPIPMSAMLEIVNVSCFYWLFKCMWWQPCQTAQLYWPYSCL